MPVGATYPTAFGGGGPFPHFVVDNSGHPVGSSSPQAFGLGRCDVLGCGAVPGGR